MVPLQMLLLGETIKVEIQTSLGVVVPIAISETIDSHVLFSKGLILDIGGLVCAQFGTHYLPKLPDNVVSN